MHRTEFSLILYFCYHKQNFFFKYLERYFIYIDFNVKNNLVSETFFQYVTWLKNQCNEYPKKTHLIKCRFNILLEQYKKISIAHTMFNEEFKKIKVIKDETVLDKKKWEKIVVAEWWENKFQQTSPSLLSNGSINVLSTWS